MAPLLDERFLLLETLGHGGMGSVVRAFDRHEERVVAIKFPKETCASGATHPLIEEFEVWSRLRHRNVVRALGMGRARRGPLPSGTPYLILERFVGVPLARALPPGGTSAGQLTAVAAEVLSALAHIHDAGLVHRDVKSSNILVHLNRTPATRVKVTDFGLAISAGRAGEFGRLSGCLAYLSPEAILGMPLDGRADLYALGIALYRQATGRHPSAKETADGLLRWHLAGDRPPEDPNLGSLPPRLARFIVRLLSPCRDDRPSCAWDALHLLGTYPTRGTAGRSHPAGRVAGGAAGLAEVAALRLALDACRRGARRVFRLPDDAVEAAGLMREARIRSLALGFDFHRLSGASTGPGDLTSGILRLLHFLGPGARSAADRHRLRDTLDIGFVGNVPVRDRPRAVPATESGSACLLRSARRVARFVAEASDFRPIILVADRTVWGNPLAAAVVGELGRSCRPEGGTNGLTGGFLVLVPSPESRRLLPRGCSGSAAGYEQPLVDPQLTHT